MPNCHLFLFVKARIMPSIAGDCKNVAAQKFLEIVLLLLGVAVYLMYYYRSLKKVFAALPSLIFILQILQCCLSKQLCQLSSLLH